MSYKLQPETHKFLATLPEAMRAEVLRQARETPSLTFGQRFQMILSAGGSDPVFVLLIFVSVAVLMIAMLLLGRL